MALTYGDAPFGEEPAGEFTFDRDAKLPVLFWQDFPKRFRIDLLGQTVVDSRRAKALHKTGDMMQICFEPRDVRLDKLSRGAPSGIGPTGPRTAWMAKDESGSRDAVAWSFEDPPPDAEFLRGWITFDLDRVDAWYQEDDLGYAHPRDPYHRYDIQNASRTVVVREGDTVLAKTDRPRILFETATPVRYYIDPRDVRTELLVRSETVSNCPYKGAGQHWNANVGDRSIANIAWTLPDPLGEAIAIVDWYSFYPEKVIVEVDGSALRS